MRPFLALLWLLLGFALFAWQATSDTRFGYLSVGGNRFSAGWFMILLCLYNLKRWRGERDARLTYRREEAARAARRERRVDEARAHEPPNPEFRFTDEPPPR